MRYNPYSLNVFVSSTSSEVIVLTTYTTVLNFTFINETYLNYDNGVIVISSFYSNSIIAKNVYFLHSLLYIKSVIHLQGDRIICLNKSNFKNLCKYKML